MGRGPQGRALKHVITIDSLFETLQIEARVQGANHDQLVALRQLEQMSEKIDDEYNPFRRAELDVTVDDKRVHVRIHEADDEGNLIVNGEWCLISVDRHGSISMSTSHDPEFVHVLAAP